MKKRRTPVVFQLNAVECGAACLAMILGYFGRKTRLEECRAKCDPGRDGVSALTICDRRARFRPPHAGALAGRGRLRCRTHALHRVLAGQTLHRA